MIQICIIFFFLGWIPTLECVLSFFHLGLAVKKIYHDSDDDDAGVDNYVLQALESMKIPLAFWPITFFFFFLEKEREGVSPLS